MITIIGSINMDLVTSVERFPKKGETLRGSSFQTVFGGKGANQAVSAARLGGDIQFIGRVGEDDFGKRYIQHLNKENIITSNVKPVTHKSTGTASITIAEGDNVILIVPGANEAMTVEVIEQAKDVISKSKIVLLQLEIPFPAIEKAIEIAREEGVKILLNPAPFYPIPASWWDSLDYVTPNEHEAEQIRRDKHFHPNYEEKMIVTEGAKGASYFENGQRKLVSAPTVKVIDTTGAGDTFNGALAVGLDTGLSLSKAIEQAVAAASLSVTAFGAQGGMPIREQLSRFLEGEE
ncbi:ribokinase [Jeotgalibacillus soli]|uniref:Ribokinase n=1 Tax=Jeotgalibacillus soli TaxID=889306 RepID=A0A0C2W059_9BACL|nr:ribokinase [Jeotgalibacillus soli]KIL49558.1 ribokinase [Jeotgalibacillus soli]